MRLPGPENGKGRRELVTGAAAALTADVRTDFQWPRPRRLLFETDERPHVRRLGLGRAIETLAYPSDFNSTNKIGSQRPSRYGLGRARHLGAVEQFAPCICGRARVGGDAAVTQTKAEPIE